MYLALPQENADEFTYLHSSQEEGDFFLSIFIESFNVDASQVDAKAGLMIREFLGPDSRHAFIYVDGTGQTGFSTRDSAGQLNKEHQEGSPSYPKDFKRGELRLKRIDNVVTGYVRAAEKEEWLSIGPIQVGFDSFFVGIAVTSSHPNMATFEFRDIVSSL